MTIRLTLKRDPAIKLVGIGPGPIEAAEALAQSGLRMEKELVSNPEGREIADLAEGIGIVGPFFKDDAIAVVKAEHWNTVVWPTGFKGWPEKGA